MKIRIRSTGDIVQPHQLRDYFPNVSFPASISEAWSLEGLAVDVVQYIDPPTGEPWQHVVENGAEHANGGWQIKYTLTPATEPAGWLDDQKALRLAVLANRRWKAEVGGGLVGNRQIATDRDSQTKITAAYLKASQDSNFSIPNWKVAPGTFITLDASTIIAIGNAVTAHVQACFDNEASLSAEILAAETYDELMAVNLESGWP